jgi:hypothetical protein
MSIIKYWKNFNQTTSNNYQTSHKTFKNKICLLNVALCFNTKSYRPLKGVDVWALKKILQIHILLAQIYKTCTKQFWTKYLGLTNLHWKIFEFTYGEHHIEINLIFSFWFVGACHKYIITKNTFIILKHTLFRLIKGKLIIAH